MAQVMAGSRPKERALVGKLERFLLGDYHDLPDLELLRKHHLAPYAYTRLPAGHAYKAELKPDFLTATSRHQRIKAELLPLLRAWQEAGIEVLLFKGFYLAEFVYGVPAERFYGDVDMLMRPEEARAAGEIAARAGWFRSFQASDSLIPFGHEIMHLDSPSKLTRLDIHRRILQNDLPGATVQQRLTDIAWGESQARLWEGARIRVLAPYDSLLLGLVLNRCWWTDGWQLKLHDYLDFDLLQQRYALDLAGLKQRAEELGCPRTLSLFLQRCNVFAKRLDLRVPPQLSRQLWNILVMPERPNPKLEVGIAKLLRAPRLLKATLQELPGLLRVLLVLQRYRDIDRILSECDPAFKEASSPLSSGQRDEIVRGVRWGLKVLGVRPGANCLPQSLAIFSSLRKRGCPAVFCSGVRRNGNTVEGHAWVEVDGRVLDELDEPFNRQNYHVNLTYPRMGASDS